LREPTPAHRARLIGQGKTLQEVLAAKVTSPYDANVPGGLLPAGTEGTSADRFVGMVYSQLKGSR
jgi:cyclase